MDGGDGVRVILHLLLEQLMNPAVRQLPPQPSQPLTLKVEFLRRQQTLQSMLSIRISSDQLQRPQVIAGDPSRAVPIEHLGPIPQPQHQLAIATRDANPEHSVLRKVTVVAGCIEPGRIENGFEGGFGEAQLAPEIIHREVAVRQQF
jgi:hypothetical protein